MKTELCSLEDCPIKFNIIPFVRIIRMQSGVLVFELLDSTTKSCH